MDFWRYSLQDLALNPRLRLRFALARVAAAATCCALIGAAGVAEVQAAPPKVKKGKATEKSSTPLKAEPAEEVVLPPPAPVPVAVAAPAPPKRPPLLLSVHSVNASPQGAVYGDYLVNYQWMFSPGHALIGELLVTWSGEESELSRGAGAQVGYRYLSNGTQNSWLFGVMAGYDVGTTTVNMTSTSTAEGSITRRFTLPYSRWRVTGNVGRRWVFGPGINATVRLGVGPGNRTFARGGSAEADHEAAVIENIVNLLPISLDSEVSVGWLF